MELKTLLWNLQDFFVFLDKHKDEELSTISEPKWQLLSSSLKDQKPHFKVQAIAELILNVDPDICFFTEVGGKESLENLNNFFLHNKYNAIHHPTNSDRGIDMGILIRKGMDFKSKMHTNKVFARGVLELMLNTNTQSIHFLLTHLKSKLNLKGLDFEGRSQRQLELEKMSDIYHKIKAKSGSHKSIILGDLNGILASDGQDYEISKFAENLGLSDALEIAKIAEIERITYVYYNKQGDPNPMQLDYVLIPESLSSSVESNATFVMNFEGKPLKDFPTSKEEFRKMPSDHYPICVTYKLD